MNDVVTVSASTWLGATTIVATGTAPLILSLWWHDRRSAEGAGAVSWSHTTAPALLLGQMVMHPPTPVPTGIP